MNKRSIVGFIEVLNFLVNALVHFIISCLLPGKAPMLMVNTILFFRNICINIKFNSQRITNTDVKYPFHTYSLIYPFHWLPQSFFPV